MHSAGIDEDVFWQSDFRDGHAHFPAAGQRDVRVLDGFSASLLADDERLGLRAQNCRDDLRGPGGIGIGEGDEDSLKRGLLLGGENEFLLGVRAAHGEEDAAFRAKPLANPGGKFEVAAAGVGRRSRTTAGSVR
jgi:hypothetical protein